MEGSICTNRSSSLEGDLLFQLLDLSSLLVQYESQVMDLLLVLRLHAPDLRFSEALKLGEL
jgi:hypothetical protein